MLASWFRNSSTCWLRRCIRTAGPAATDAPSTVSCCAFPPRDETENKKKVGAGVGGGEGWNCMFGRRRATNSLKKKRNFKKNFKLGPERVTPVAPAVARPHFFLISEKKKRQGGPGAALHNIYMKIIFTTSYFLFSSPLFFSSSILSATRRGL